MRISEVITEDVEEGVMGTIGRGVAGTLGGIAKGAGMLAGVGRGMKSAFQKGKATSAAHIAGDVPKPIKTVDPTYSREYARLTRPAAQNAPAAPSAKIEPTMGGNDPAALKSQAAQLKQQASDLEKQATEIEKQQADANKAAVAAPAAPAPTGDAAAPAAPAKDNVVNFSQGGYGDVKMKAPTGGIPTAPKVPGAAASAAPTAATASKPAATSADADAEADRERLLPAYGESLDRIKELSNYSKDKFHSKFLNKAI